MTTWFLPNRKSKPLPGGRTWVCMLALGLCGQSPAQSGASTPQTASAMALSQNVYPRWFRDGKLGIWAHWGPQSVPMEGDWYARNMYVQGSRQYDDHLARFGHPSKAGYKDIIPLWHAEKWDPDRLMKLYKAAGAKYFVSMGVHHDNFDLWNSKFNRWNAVNMGPKRDVVGTWQKAAKKEGLHFGVSEHLGASFLWFQVARSSDAKGPLAGTPYDGNDPQFEDLYHRKALPGDSGWYTQDPRFQTEWYRRISDLVDQYHPDLLYTDGGLPFGHFGEDLVAHFYADSKARHGGEQQAVYTCKQISDGRWAQDVERGVMGKIQAYPWQTDTSIGDWFYNKNWPYRHADWVIRTLVDVVSKNGNLLINVVQRPDGSLDPEAEKVLADMSAWMKVNHESVYGTRPWVTFGEGSVRAHGGGFQEDFGFTAADIRYASKGDHALYATMLGKAKSGEVVLKMLAKNPSDGLEITGVSLLGSSAKIHWDWLQDGLHVRLPEGKYDPIASVLKIRGTNMRSVTIAQPVLPVAQADSAGNFNLSADLAELVGEGIGTEMRNGKPNIAFWNGATDYPRWTVESASGGTYEASAWIASEKAGSSLEFKVNDQTLDFTVPAAGGWADFKEYRLGSVHLESGAKSTITFKPKDPALWSPINLRSIILRRVP